VIRISVCTPPFDNNILPFDVPNLAQALPESLGAVSVRGKGRASYPSDPGDFRWLLRLGERNNKQEDSKR
jgi:hypothetical protein